MMNQKQFSEIRAKIIARAWKDPEFKKRLIQNPKAALKEMGVQIPDNVKITIVEDKNNSYTFVLPTAATSSKEELTEKELGMIAGGAAGTSSYCVC